MTLAPIYTDIKIKNFPTLKRVEPKVIDHSGLKLFKQCQMRYFFRVVLGLQPKGFNIYLGWGTAYHKFREVLEKEYIRTGDRAESFKTASIAATNYWEKNIKDPPPGTSLDFLNKQRFIESCTVAYKDWLVEKKTNKIIVVSVEQSFSIVLPDGTETCGRIDQIVRWVGRLWIKDFKTSKKHAAYFETSVNPNDQATRYTYAASNLNGQPVQGVMFDVLHNTKTKGPELYVSTTTRNQEQIDNWLIHQAFWSKLLRIAREEDIYGQDETQCGWCDYRDICKQSSQAAQLNVIKTNFKFDPWDPLSHND